MYIGETIKDGDSVTVCMFVRNQLSQMNPRDGIVLLDRGG